MVQLSLSAYPLNITATQIQEFVMVHEFLRRSSSQTYKRRLGDAEIDSCLLSDSEAETRH